MITKGEMKSPLSEKETTECIEEFQNIEMGAKAPWPVIEVKVMDTRILGTPTTNASDIKVGNEEAKVPIIFTHCN